ncbi:MAG TPA: hypothetical protein VK712_03995 [Verrucomicrobiae bacterium]|nr:hypothetical protein [Verrucomicrobiae bacterium]
MDTPEIFEELSSGQLPPDEWYDYSLHEDFPHLSPVSNIGEIAVSLASTRASLAEDWKTLLEEDVHEEGPEDPELTKQSQAWLRTELNNKIFSGFYEDIHEALQLMQKNGNTPVLHDELVSDIYKKQLELTEK